MSTKSVPTLPTEVIEAFDTMWGNFPEPASLVHKSFYVMAVNKAHKKTGALKAGMRCIDSGPPQCHAGCLAQKAVKEKHAEYRYNKYGEIESVGFWIPLDDYPEFFLHFTVGLTINYKTKQENNLIELLAAIIK
jgi:hypothetical protein